MTDAPDEVKRMAEEAADRAFEKHVKGRLGGTEPDARDEPLLRALADIIAEARIAAKTSPIRYIRGHDGPAIARRWAGKQLSAIRPLLEEREREAYERGRSEAIKAELISRQDGERLAYERGQADQAENMLAARKSIETAAHNAALEEAAEVARQAERDCRAAVRHYQKEGGNFTLASEMYARAEEAKSLLDAIRALKR